MFSKEERSTFGYWFAHWCAFQMTALNLKVWRLKYLCHDISKPWLRLFLSYEKVQKIHRKHSKHHIEYKNPEKIDWMSMVIDWECSRFTKQASPLNAREEFNQRIYHGNKKEVKLLLDNFLPIINKLKI